MFACLGSANGVFYREKAGGGDDAAEERLL